MKCQHCGKELSPTAKFCDDCAYATPLGVVNTTPQATTTSAEARSNNTALIIVLSVVGVFVMLAIIGILSSVVLVSLNVAREKGKDAQAEARLKQIRSIIELNLTERETGISKVTSSTCSEGVFTDPRVQQEMGILINEERNPRCFARGASYAISTDMKSSETSYCVDNAFRNGLDSIATDDGVQAQCVSVPTNNK